VIEKGCLVQPFSQALYAAQPLRIA